MFWNLFGIWKVRGDGYSVTIGRRGQLFYEEGGSRFLVNAIEGGGYGIVVEEMADADLSLSLLSMEQRLRVALNIKRALEAHNITVDVYKDHGVVASG